jgi:UDP-N-acetylmuramoyl-tripeptide--D-alanyl-D-alanine ligase
VPLTLLSFTNQTQIGVVEMGANHQKEIEFLCQIAKPDYGYITNFGKAHLEGFGGVEGVIKGKSEMYLYLFENHKTVFVNADDILQYDKTVNSKRVTFSCHNKECDVFFSKIEANPFVSIQFNDVYIQSHLIGLYNATNSCAAITIGSYFGVSKHDIKQAIESYIPENNRSQIVKKGTNEIILDAYNANPTSMKAALENFLQLDKPHKMIIVGDMFELGTASLEEHRIIVNFLKEESCITCCFVGSDFFSNKIEKENFFFFKDFDTLSTFLSGNHLENRSILIKGSRGMALERTLEFI